MRPSVAAVQAGKKLALANKESLVVAGGTILPLAVSRGIPIIPIDSEHSAIFQCLAGEVSPLRRLIITASGGPFLHTPVEELDRVSVEQALRHPNWNMGPKITIDSATMVNKGFEVIEAHWLFGVPAEKIDVLIHPQSVVHSMVEFEDGAVKAQLGTPDMRLPIQYALLFPQRADFGGSRYDFLSGGGTLCFEAVDREKFPALDLAYEVLRRGGNAGCVMNGANEAAVHAFLDRRIGYRDIVRIIARVLEEADFVATPTMEDYAESDRQAREMAEHLIGCR